MLKNCLYCGNPMQSERITKKYCSDNCKQLAFNKRKLIPIKGGVVEDNIIDSDEQQDFTFKEYDEQEVESIHTATEKEIAEKAPAPYARPAPVNIHQETDYEWISSSFVEKVSDYITKSKDALYFQYIEDYWGAYTLPAVKWVSLRLRCLLENLIWLHNQPSIEFDTLIALKKAFTALKDSIYFMRLPSNYPNTTLIKNLEQKLAAITQQHKSSDQIQFRISQKLRIELIAKRFMMAGFVPAVKFYDLDFGK